MRNVKLTVPLLIGKAHYDAGKVVTLPDIRAVELVKLGHAEHHQGPAEIANPDHDPDADSSESAPPDEGRPPAPGKGRKAPKGADDAK